MGARPDLPDPNLLNAHRTALPKVHVNTHVAFQHKSLPSLPTVPPVGSAPSLAVKPEDETKI